MWTNTEQRFTYFRMVLAMVYNITQLLVEMSSEVDQSTFSHPPNLKMCIAKLQISSIRSELKMKKMVSFTEVLFQMCFV